MYEHSSLWWSPICLFVVAIIAYAFGVTFKNLLPNPKYEGLPWNQRSNCQHPLDHGKRKRVPEKSISAFLTMPKPLTVWITINWKILKEMGIPDHPTCLLRNLYAGQEATVRTGHGTTDLFQIGKGVCQGCILSPCLFNLYAEYIMRNTGLEAQAGIKIARRNINNLRYADDTTLTNHYTVQLNLT